MTGSLLHRSSQLNVEIAASSSAAASEKGLVPADGLAVLDMPAGALPLDEELLREMMAGTQGLPNLQPVASCLALSSDESCWQQSAPPNYLM